MERIIKEYFPFYKKFSPSILKIDPSIVNFCKKNKCGNYNRNYMCPPIVEKFVFTKCHTCYVFQQSSINSQWEKSKIEFHLKLLNLEEVIKNKFSNLKVKVFIGGSCALCSPCKVIYNKKCKFPEKARPSLEAVGVNVIDLLKKLNLPFEFNDDIVTWTGALLIK